MAGVMDILNRQSGVLGISGVSELSRPEKAAEEGHERAHLALTVFAYSVARGIGSLIPSINGLDAGFHCGIVEHSPHINRICFFLSWLGIVRMKIK